MKKNLSADLQKWMQEARERAIGQVQRRHELRRSNAATPHRNRAKEAKHPGKGNRHNWKKDL